MAVYGKRSQENGPKAEQDMIGQKEQHDLAEEQEWAYMDQWDHTGGLGVPGMVSTPHSPTSLLGVIGRTLLVTCLASKLH